MSTQSIDDKQAAQLDIAQRLCDRAIRMFFEGEDPVVTLVVANPAHVMLHEIARSRLGEGNSASRLVGRLKAKGYVTASGAAVDKVSDLMSVVRRDANSLKHSKLEPNVELESIIATILTAASDAQDLGIVTAKQVLFVAWAWARQLSQMPYAWEVVDWLFPRLEAMNPEQQLKEGLAKLASADVMQRLEEAIQSDRNSASV